MGPVRAAKTKVRTGCRTCKARRVKCDETKPECQKCSRAGRICEGYEVIAPRSISRQYQRVLLPGGPRQSNALWDQNMVLRISSPSHAITGATPEEMTYFDFFRRYTAPTISGSFPSAFFERFVLQLGMQEPIVRHAATALAALQLAQERSGRITLSQEQASFALRQNIKSIALMRERLNAVDLCKADVHSQRVALVANVLFVAYEIAQKRFAQTAVHLENGLSMLLNVRYKGKLPESWEDDFDVGDGGAALDSELLRTFDRLDIQSTFFRSTKPRLVTTPALTAQRTPRKFQSLEQAREYLNSLTRSISAFRHEVRATPSPFAPEDYARLEQQQIQIRTQMQAWYAAFGSLRLHEVPLPPGQTPPTDAAGRATLEAMATSSNILLETGIADGRESIFDSFHSDFRMIVELSEIVQNNPRSPDRPLSLQNGGTSFHIHMGCIPGVYVVALKCRDPVLRRRAIALLESFTFREGLWDGPMGARLTQHVCELEESGFEDVTYAEDLPERARIHEAMFDIADRVGGVKAYYKRRDFEGEYGEPGAWVVWTDRAYVMLENLEEPNSKEQ